VSDRGGQMSMGVKCPLTRTDPVDDVVLVMAVSLAVAA